ncbi:uncharacterized protein LOC106477903 [Limulus polyphemus]|uniref:Uncharacterized protein LOC106477903 n=1 Tax=Limulus polyphemus TaxID=6850 RepID=A0ABM1C4A5_LIMPO|nr:uncharacterized protein LOC106477903 [Limulus polyphemus]
MLYGVFIAFEKDFDSLHRESLWKILLHYGIPQEIVNVIKSLYNGCKCKVICDNQFVDSYNVNGEVKQDCILSPFLFILVVDWLMRILLEHNNWTHISVLEDLDYIDDVSLIQVNMLASKRKRGIYLPLLQKYQEHIC